MSTRTTALRLHRHGGPLVLEDVALARPAAQEVLVDLERAGVNPVDRATAHGLVAPDGPLPRTLGGEAAGRLDGTRVVVAGAGLGLLRDGLWSRQAVVPEGTVTPVPDGVGMDEAAAAAVVGVTAHTCLVTLAHVGPDDRVLVLAASGGVGVALVSLAAGLGATVVAQTGSPQKAPALLELGAHEVVHADAGTLADAAQELRPTVVVDALGGAYTPAALSVLQPFGRYVLFGVTAGPTAALDLGSLYRKNISLLGYSVLAQPMERRSAAVGLVLAALADGRMRIPVARRVPLAAGATVLDVLGDRSHVGKVLLDLS